ncbi:hypothetical protein CAI21_22280 [Alkalilimnicola ehrlichii]|uniref:Uncharacterized protein n=1 Tax=Alkalilimnicola ehrlichii TaxID=351052 RepID=A0A3E0WEZ4_9GAMM|nr:hypothetical protein CAI21_22280 [Alkalilimnicola ehrlichii]RFA31514.1 hypothetical protein CAL65_22495 [Alkalilimnicola ehrlichii]
MRGRRKAVSGTTKAGMGRTGHLRFVNRGAGDVLNQIQQQNVPGIDRPFRQINPEHPPNAAVVEHMSSMRICTGTDCSEIADALRNVAGEGRILRVTGQGGGDLRLLEHGRVDSGFRYHEVFTDGRYVYDPRLNDTPVPEGDWIRMIQGLNPGALIE